MSLALLDTVTSVSASIESTLTEDKSQGLFIFVGFLSRLLLFYFAKQSLDFSFDFKSTFVDVEESESESEEEAPAPAPAIPKV